MRSIKQIRGSWRVWYARRSWIARVTLWVLRVLIVSLIAGEGFHFLRVLWIAIDVMCAMLLAPLLLILFFRWFTRQFLWKVRNRLILTYLLMGLAPVVLFATLTGIAAYLFCGQYATNSALSALDQASIEVRDEAANTAMLSLPGLVRTGMVAPQSPAEGTDVSHISVDVLKDGVWKPLVGSPADKSGETLPVLNQPSPAWLHPGFRGLVTLQRRLYSCAVVSVPVGGRMTTVLGSMPVNGQTLGEMVKGLGTVQLMQGITGFATDSNDAVVVTKTADQKPARKPSQQPDQKADDGDEGDFAGVKGGVLPPRSHFYDTPVLFSAPLTVVSWKTGDPSDSSELPLVVVVSRPSLLYAHLFATASSTGIAVRVALIGIAIIFALLELVAMLMAVGLSRTITRSVSDLYDGTREIDAGNLAHRVRVARRPDQLGALAMSFNSMAASVSELMVQQREKERLLNELAIAREVQTNLFPQSPAKFGAFEMHAVCLPARTIGGDYYDFIYNQGRGPNAAQNGVQNAIQNGVLNGGQSVIGQDSGLCFALGDISGKGISAALVMASLHSAVRAFILDSRTRGEAVPSPSGMLTLINNHLLRSTQVERYATLFLACYSGADRRLTYANGGHLPPLVLSRDGSVRALDCGGPVVGLLSGLDYFEASVQLDPGDLLMAFSDGLTEPEKAGDEFGAERLLEYIRSNRMQPLPMLAANTLKTVQAWIGDNEQPDDMTLLLARQL